MWDRTAKASGGIERIGTPGGTTRSGSSARSPKWGSVRNTSSRSCTTKVAWPTQVIAALPGATESDAPSLATVATSGSPLLS